MSRLRLAIQGGPCSFSHQAARTLLEQAEDDIHYRFLAGFPEVLNELMQGHADAVLLPVENSHIGPIPGIQDLLKKSRLVHRASLWLPVRHCLVGLPGADESALRTVHSHPAALAQCQQFLSQHPKLQAVEEEDTANSLSLLRVRGQGNAAAIASVQAACFHGLPLIRKDIQDQPDNRTHFQLFTAP
ncbi:prephenate dehydratase [Natronospira proteinivora]|uniref:prephenate dehydratase n=1 Tax=Natronospira proteinivora TaxID=1807133 RepID=A0ABT1GBG5_9GAMM|nr:prephenate dehydratase domain-containing protein [Natronospira proteinivora]MCP1728638.1 prephenate dehydratase [Natronospira proteinivora]